MPGFAAQVLELEADRPAPDDEPGRLAIVLPDSPLMWFTGYVDEPERTAQRYSRDGSLYLTGDLARRLSSGAFAFTSRDDDVILMAGYRVGPLEVESALMGHPAVAEAAVIGIPDPLKGEAIIAHVILRRGFEGGVGRGLRASITEHVRHQLGPIGTPAEIKVVDALPKTRSGKIMRRVLRAQALGQDPGDLTTLEG